MNSNHGHWGHDHFWQRALSRRQFIGSGALAGAAMLSSPLWAARLAEAAAFNEADPRHILGGTTLPNPPFLAPPNNFFHFFFPGAGDISTIRDFHGMVGVADIPSTGGTAVGSLQWEADVRFMKGSYIGTEGDTRTGAF